MSVSSYEFVTDEGRIDPEQVFALLRTTYWAAGREFSRMRRIMKNSLNFALLDGQGRLRAYCRVVTDYETMFYLADVIVAPEERGMGLGRALIKNVLEDERLKPLKGLLQTRDAQPFYERFGFTRQGDKLMLLPR